MYTATMEYRFVKSKLEEITGIWKEEVLIHAEKQPGLIRMQFLTSSTGAMAIGTWTDKSAAEDFMKTGVFKKLMDKLESMLLEPPTPRIWDLALFFQN